MNCAILWDLDPEITNLFGISPIRYYSLLFAGGLFLGYIIVQSLLLREHWSREKIDQLAFYIVIATLVGARLGNCLLYEPSYYLSHPWEIILPFRWELGTFQWVGYQGLASHGGIFGVFVAIYWFCRKTQSNLLFVLDRVAIGGALTAIFIRLGNLMNSEIVGKPTGSDYGFVFSRLDNLPRHPSQLYEALAYGCIFILLFALYQRPKVRERKGFLFGLFFTLTFTARFVLEFFKADQVAFEDQMWINMGQVLSIPFLLFGIGVMIYSMKRKVTSTVC